MAIKENNNVVENTTVENKMFKSFDWDAYENIHKEGSDIDCTFDAVTEEPGNKLNEMFQKNEVLNKVYHQRLKGIFSVLYVFMDKSPKGWEVNIRKCKNFSVEMMYEVSKLLAKMLENSINQEKLMIQDIAIYIEINNMLDALNDFIARCGSTAALTNDESFRILRAETIEKLVYKLDNHIAI